VAEFLQELAETWEPVEISYPLLWELRQSQTEAVLNSLPEMAKSPSQLMLNMKDDCTMPTSGAGLTPFGRCKANTQLFGSSANYSMQMLACLEMPEHDVVDVFAARDNGELMDMVMQSRRRYLDDCPEGPSPVLTADAIKSCLKQFGADEYSCRVKQRWLVNALRIPERSQEDEAVLHSLLDKLVDDFCSDLSFGPTKRSKHGLATCALYRHLLIANAPKPKCAPLPLGPALRLLANAGGSRGKQYLPQNLCGDDVELTANGMPAYWRRLQDSAARPSDDSSLAVASPPVMCWICGEGFLYNGALLKHCCEAHGDYAEYRKRLFWRVQKDGFKPLLPWVKRHILESATFHLTYSVPGSFSLKWNHPEAFRVAKERSEVACVVCARKDWLESRFTVYLWRKADGASSYSELQHTDSGTSQLLTNGEHLCFGNRDVIDQFLNTKFYSEKFPLIPPEHLYASSALHPEDEGMSWLLHTRRVPLIPDSRRPPRSGAEQPAAESPGSAAQPALRHKCAGVGDIDAVAHIKLMIFSYRCQATDPSRISTPSVRKTHS